MKVWEAQTGQEIFSLKGGTCAAFSPDSQRLGCASGYSTGMGNVEVDVWDTGSE